MMTKLQEVSTGNFPVEAMAVGVLPTSGSDTRPEAGAALDERRFDGIDVVALIAGTNAGRNPALLKRKFDLISTDAFAFLRATAAIGHAALDLGAVPASPLAWVTGDLHVENFGTYKGDNGLVYFDLNDFDEAARLPLAVDLVRLLSSIVASSRALGFENETRRRMLQTVLTRTGAAFAKGKPTWIERETASGTLRVLIDQVAFRRRRDLVAALTIGRGKKRKLKIDGKRILAFDDLKGRYPYDTIRQSVESCLNGRDDEVEIRDIAIRASGKGSLGLPRYVLLARRLKDRQSIFLDLKYAAGSSPAAWFGAPQPAFSSEAERIVSVQEFCQAVSPARLSGCTVGRDSFVLRMLQPQEDKVDFAGLAKDPLVLSELFARMGEIHAAGVLRSAGRQGSAGPDALIAFGQELGQESQAWIEAAIDVEADIRGAFKDFRRAWKNRDPRLTIQTRPRHDSVTSSS